MNQLPMFNTDVLECGFCDALPTLKYATDVIRAVGIGELMSKPEKMPEWSFNIPAKTCKAGKHLVSMEGSDCFMCYALEGHYRNSVVQAALERRYRFVVHNPNFIPAMTFLINLRVKERFRWFDSGDIQSQKMLDDICKICRNTPHILHWLPTKEWKICKRYIEAGNKIPDNLDLRLSALSINGRPPTKRAKRLGLNTSTVMTADVWGKFIASKSKGIRCPSSTQDNECKDCEACWVHKVVNVGYKWH